MIADIFALIKTLFAIILLMTYYCFLYVVSSILRFINHFFFGGKVLLDEPVNIPVEKDDVVQVPLKGKVD